MFYRCGSCIQGALHIVCIYDTVNMHMNGQLKTIRISKGFTQEALGKEAGVDKSTIYRLEKHMNNPSPTTVRKLARCLGVEPEELMSEQERLNI